MADPALRLAPVAPVFTAASLKAFIISVLIYWGASALLLPVTTWDCQVYNLARLIVAERAGFWQAEAWNSIREVTYPWTFDAVHYPFLKTGWGFGIPSFVAFLGLLVIIFQLVKPRFGEHAALWSILTLLSMPTLMLQATTTKNDIVIVFGVGCWVYSLVRFQRSRNKLFLFTAALCIAFIVGSKNLGLGVFVIAALATGWLLRRAFRNLLLFAFFLGPLLLLFGSIETYVLSWRLYRDPVGPKQFVNDQLNGDGPRGAVANFFRYYMANISIGIDGIDCNSGFPDLVQKECRVLLSSLGLEDAGCRRDYRDANLPFLKNGFDSGYDFGVVGCLALFVSSCVIFRPNWRDVRWWLSTTGFLAMLPVSIAIAWAPWNVRYFCLSFALFGISLALLVFSTPHDRSWLQLGLGVFILWSAISLPLHCAQRRPFDLWSALFAREDVSLGQRPEIIPVYNDVLKLRANRADQWFLVATENSWTLPFLQAKMEWQLTPQWEQVKARLPIGEQKDSYALILDTQLPQDLPIEIVKKYQHSTFIVRILSGPG
ncbi:MAG TPA: glycosyltransferase family 39 protein [Candidatus Acidoferrum sp.]|nr:glycosyltransferase family 39 protein [Candidatus Acidoferrum sp.]